MDPDYSLQDIIRCELCDTSAPQLYCKTCHINLCKACTGEHLLDEYKFHLVVLLKHRLSNSTFNYPKCTEHSTQLCELHCDQCSIPVCVQCVSSKEHNTHDVVDIIKFMERKKMAIETDGTELMGIIIPRYNDISSSILIRKRKLKKNTKKLIADITKRGEFWQDEIKNIIEKLKSDIQAVESRRLADLNKQEGEIEQSILKIRQNFEQTRNLFYSNDVNLLSKYKSKNAEFKRFPHMIAFPLPKFSSPEIDTKQLFQQFGILSNTNYSSSDEDDSESVYDTSYYYDDDDDDDNDL